MPNVFASWTVQQPPTILIEMTKTHIWTMKPFRFETCGQTSAWTRPPETMNSTNQSDYGRAICKVVTR